MVCVIVYDIHIESYKDRLEVAWEIENPLSFLEFRDQRGRKVLAYILRPNHYPWTLSNIVM